MSPRRIGTRDKRQYCRMRPFQHQESLAPLPDTVPAGAQRLRSDRYRLRRVGHGTDGNGKPTVHEYLTGPAQANDVAFSVHAVRTAFPEFSKKFVVIGSSLGGGGACYRPHGGVLGDHCIIPRDASAEPTSGQ